MIDYNQSKADLFSQKFGIITSIDGISCELKSAPLVSIKICRGKQGFGRNHLVENSQDYWRLLAVATRLQHGSGFSDIEL